MNADETSSPSPANLHTLLQQHVGADTSEVNDLERMRHFAASLAQPFSRRQPEAHFTGSAVVVDPSGTRVLLLHHAKLGRWLQPGGHADPEDGGEMQQTALREAHEETGCQVHLHPTAPRPLDVDIHTIPARRDEAEHLHLDVRFLVVATDPDAMAHDPAESHAAEWRTWEEALARADEAPLRRLLAKAYSLATR